MSSNTDRDFLESLEAAVHPDIDSGADCGGLTVKGVGDNQEVVRPNSEELPVISSRRGQSLVHFKHLTGRKEEEKSGENRKVEDG